MVSRILVAALKHFSANKGTFLNDLKDLVRIPSISFPGFDHEPVRRCAGAVEDHFRARGFKDVRMLEAETGNPSVFAQWTGAPGKPTILLYAHYDVQPVGREELWTTPPFELSERNGRLFGRGSADDKGGVAMYLAALGSYLQSVGVLPVNIKVLIEGEEEVGSSNLNAILEKNRALLSADAVVIADSENFDSGVPTLTASLRGIVTVSVEVRSLASSVHSGTWGGPLPDPVIALSRMIAGLVDDAERPAIPGLSDAIRTLSSADRANLDALPFNEALYRRQSKLLDGAQLVGGEGSVYEKMWYRPSIAVNAIEASSRKQAANIINDVAWARIGIRIVPDMDPGKTLELLTGRLKKLAPWGVQVTVRPETPSPWWKTDTNGPVFAAALTALEKGYNRKPVVVGAGGSIPFVQTITEALGGVPVATWTWVASYLAWADSPVGHHFFNLVLQWLCGVLLFSLLRRWGFGPWLAALLASIWWVSPYALEATVSCSARFDSLLLASWLGMALAWPAPGARWTESRAAAVDLEVQFASPLRLGEETVGHLDDVDIRAINLPAFGKAYENLEPGPRQSPASRSGVLHHRPSGGQEERPARGDRAVSPRGREVRESPSFPLQPFAFTPVTRVLLSGRSVTPMIRWAARSSVSAGRR